MNPDPASNAPRANQSAVAGIAVVAVLLVIVLAAMFSSPDQPADESITLTATVNFDGARFIVTNASKTQRWTDTTLAVNSRLFGGGYELNVGDVAPLGTVTAGAMQFAKPDGTRFNPIQMKPQTLNISAIVDGKRGFYYGGWK